MIFVDTSVWYALLVPTDADHARSLRWYRANTSPLLTTDYVVDEVLTLLRARGERDRALAAGRSFFAHALAKIHYVDHEGVTAGCEVFRRFSDKQWSFTDCVSYAIIKSWDIEIAASLDHHFRQFGLSAIVP